MRREKDKKGAALETTAEQIVLKAQRNQPNRNREE
jgi:hypothetical protein